MAFDQLPEVQPDSQKLNLIALWVETWLYGMYTILFFVCVYILYHRRHSAFLFRATVMFALSTAHVVLDFIRAEKSSTRLERAPITVYLINNLIADELVVLRCYIIWGKRKRVMIIPALLVITTAVLSYISETMVILLTSLITNVVVSGLTAGRIWWIGRQARGYLSKEITREYNTAIAIILESGAIYCISLMICLIVSIYTPVSEITLGVLAQIVGIVPTLIIVRVGLGHSTDSVEGPVSVSVTV